MKTTLVLLAALLAGVAFFDLRAQSSGGSSSGSKIAYPYGLECVLTLDPTAERPLTVSAPSTPDGYKQDLVLRGQLIYMSDEWCVLKDGTFENWVPRDKILSFRVSK